MLCNNISVRPPRVVSLGLPCRYCSKFFYCFCSRYHKLIYECFPPQLPHCAKGLIMRNSNLLLLLVILFKGVLRLRFFSFENKNAVRASSFFVSAAVTTSMLSTLPCRRAPCTAQYRTRSRSESRRTRWDQYRQANYFYLFSHLPAILRC